MNSVNYKHTYAHIIKINISFTFELEKTDIEYTPGFFHLLKSMFVFCFNCKSSLIQTKRNVNNDNIRNNSNNDNNDNNNSRLTIYHLLKKV